MKQPPYPRIIQTEYFLQNTHELCPCKQVARYQSVIERSTNRSKDERVFRCEKHKYSVEMKNG